MLINIEQKYFKISDLPKKMCIVGGTQGAQNIKLFSKIIIIKRKKKCFNNIQKAIRLP